MLRLTANKTKLYTLVAGYVENLPPMRGGTIFVKYPRTPDYALDWITPEKITCDKCGRRRYGLPYEVKRVFFTGGSRK